MQSFKGNNQQQNRIKIDRWETFRRIVDAHSNSDTLPVSLYVSIERPIFANGDAGYYRVNAKISVGNHYVRLATRSILDLLDMFSTYRRNILDAVDEVRDLNAKHEKNQQDGNISRKRDPRKNIPVPRDDYPILTKHELNRGHGRHRDQQKRPYPHKDYNR